VTPSRDTQPGSLWGHEFMWPDEASYEDFDGWLSRDAIPDPEGAITAAAQALEVPRERIELVPVLMREESEVEAKINGHEFPCWVECTRRARKPEPFWRVVILDGEGLLMPEPGAGRLAVQRRAWDNEGTTQRCRGAAQTAPGVDTGRCVSHVG
jgi:hypothetical protein